MPLEWHPVSPERPLPAGNQQIIVQLKEGTKYAHNLRASHQERDDDESYSGAYRKLTGPYCVVVLVAWAKDGFGRQYPVNFRAECGNIPFADVSRWALIE
jgi:hypothetical protein